MAWESSPTIVERFFLARDVVSCDTGKTYQGFMKALRRSSDRLLPALSNGICGLWCVEPPVAAGGPGGDGSP